MPVRRRRSDDPPSRGTVLEQDPRAGVEAEKGSTVTLSVAAARGDAEVPDVVGQPQDEAREELEDANFRVKTREDASSDVDAGSVISTSPSPGVTTRVGSTVVMTVSTGPQMVTVPDVLGATESAAGARGPPSSFEALLAQGASG